MKSYDLLKSVENKRCRLWRDVTWTSAIPIITCFSSTWRYKKHFPVLFQTTTFEISVTWFSSTWRYKTFSRTFFPVLFFRVLFSLYFLSRTFFFSCTFFPCFFPPVLFQTTTFEISVNDTEGQRFKQIEYVTFLL